MKRIVGIVLGLLLVASAAFADGPYYVKIGQRCNVSFELNIDTTGQALIFDSLQIFGKRGDLGPTSAPSFFRNWTSYSAAVSTSGSSPTGGGWCDSLLNVSGSKPAMTMNVYADSLGAVGYQYSVWIRQYSQGKLTLEKTFSIYITASNLIELLAYKLDSNVVYRQMDSALRTLAITADSLKGLINAYQGIQITQVSSGATATSIPTTLTQTSTDFWKYKSFCMVTGSLKGQVRAVTGYNGTTKALTTDAFTAAPSSGDSGLLIPGAGSSSGGGGGTVTGYAVGQDPATLVLGATGSSWNTAGTIGALINWAGTSSNFLSQTDLGYIFDTINDVAATTTSFIGKKSVTGTDYWKDRVLVIMSGAQAGVARRINAYNYSTKTYTVDALPLAPANGVAFITFPIGASQSVTSVTVAGYTSGNAPEERLLVTPANKLYTNSSGRIDLGRWLGVDVAAPMAGGYPKVDIYGYRGFGPVGVPTLSGGSYYPNAWDVLDNVNGSLLGSVGSLGINAISEPSFQSGAFSSRVVSTGALDSSAITNALIDKIIARFVQKDTAGAGYTFGTTSLGKLFSQTGAQSLDSQIVSRIVWGIVWGVAKTANNTDTSQVAGRTVSGLSVTIDSAQISRIVKRVVWGIASGSGSDSTSAAQRVISFDIATLVNAIWNELKSGHNVTGSFGSFVDARISSVSGASGNGAYSWDVYLVDTSASPDSVIQNAQVWINNPAQNTQPYWAITDNTGKGHFQLNAGSWVTFTTEPGFGQTLRAFSMSGSGRDTLKLYKGNTGRSMLALYGGLGSGTRWDSSRVEIELVSVNDSLLMVGDTVIASNGKGFITAYTNHFGQATIPLYSNETFTNDSTYYRMSVRDMRRGKLLSRFAFRMPTSSATVWLKDVTTWREN